MILRRCREVVEKFAKQPVRDVVITVPAFFNQAERRALVAAAEIAELNLLQVRLILKDVFFCLFFLESSTFDSFFVGMPFLLQILILFTNFIFRRFMNVIAQIYYFLVAE